MDYDVWVEKEYDLWEENLKIILEENSINTFRQNAQVERMVGITPELGYTYYNLIKDRISKNLLLKISEMDRVGSPVNLIEVEGILISSVSLRYLYYSFQVVLSLVKNVPIKILEIGAGYGGFSSIFHLVVKEVFAMEISKYAIFDKPLAQSFQKKYLDLVYTKNKAVFLDCSDIKLDDEYDLVVSFYALGEFSSEVRNEYIDKVINKIPRGYVIWNPHLDEQNQIYTPETDSSLKKIDQNLIINKEFPLTGERNLELRW